MAWSRTDAALLRAVAEPLRAEIIRLLGAEQLCTCHLVAITGATQTNVSNHLRVLRDAGVVTAAPAGRYTYYRLRAEPLARLSEQLGKLAAAASDPDPVRRPCP